MATTSLLNMVKTSLSIVSTSTTKDDEITIWIDSAKLDLARQGVDVDTLIDNALVIGAIVMYVKGHFGMCDIKEKDQALQTYKDICYNLPLSNDYIHDVDVDDEETLIAMDNREVWND